MFQALLNTIIPPIKYNLPIKIIYFLMDLNYLLQPNHVFFQDVNHLGILIYREKYATLLKIPFDHLTKKILYFSSSCKHLLVPEQLSEIHT